MKNSSAMNKKNTCVLPPAPSPSSADRWCAALHWIKGGSLSCHHHCTLHNHIYTPVNGGDVGGGGGHHAHLHRHNRRTRVVQTIHTHTHIRVGIVLVFCTLHGLHGRTTLTLAKSGHPPPSPPIRLNRSCYYTHLSDPVYSLLLTPRRDRHSVSRRRWLIAALLSVDTDGGGRNSSIASLCV